MDVRIISDILHYCNKTIPLFKNFLNRILKSKSIIFNSHKTNILKKIKNELTWPLNKYFLLLIFSACLLTISITCLLQLKQFKTELKNQGEFIYKHTESKLQNYHDSLKTLIKLLLYKHSYLNAQKTTQIIKLAFVTEQHLQLLPLTWHSLSGSPKVYNHYGLITSKSILNVLRSNEKLISEKLSLTSAEHSNYFEIDREIDQFGEARLILYMPVLDKVKYNLLNTNNSKEQNLMVGVGLVGYLRLPVKISVILSELYDRFAVNDLLRLSNNSDIFYLSKSNDKYILNNNPDIKNFHFSDSFKLASSDYSISIGKDFQLAFKQGAKKSIHYCGIIIIIGALFILIYNLFERRRIKNAYDEKFSASLISADMQTQELSTKLASKNQELALSLEQNIGYLKSNKALVDIEQQINLSYSKALNKIKDCNYLLLKHFSKEKILPTERVEGLFAEIYQISEDLSRNIASKEQKTTETNLVQIACEVLTIFAPLSLKRSVEIRTNLDTFKDKNQIILKTNELILKQLLISFIARVFFFISANSELTFLVHKISNNKSVKIEITYQGISLNEPLFQDIVFRKQNDMIAGIIRSIFTMETIESLLRDYLNGDIEIKSDSKTNHITCILPTEYAITDKVVYLSNLSWIGE